MHTCLFVTIFSILSIYVGEDVEVTEETTVDLQQSPQLTDANEVHSF